MRRAILVALGIGTIVTSAAAIGITATAMPGAAIATSGDLTITQVKRLEASARIAQRARIDERYAAERAQCESVSGLRHDRCLIAVHARHGHALLEAAAPYQVRY